MNLVWISKPNMPQISGPFWPENSKQSGLELQGNIALKSRSIGQSCMKIWANLIWPGNMAWKFRPIWPGVIGQYGQENPGKSGLDIWANLVRKLRTIWSGNPGQLGLEIWAYVAWKSEAIWPRNLFQSELRMRIFWRRIRRKFGAISEIRSKFGAKKVVTITF